MHARTHVLDRYTMNNSLTTTDSLQAATTFVRLNIFLEKRVKTSVTNYLHESDLHITNNRYSNRSNKESV